AAAWPWSGLAQSPPKRPLIGLLLASSKKAGAPYYGGFSSGMRELGYLEGRDYAVEERYSDGDASRLPSLAQELVRLKPDVIVAATTPGTLAVKQATAGIPIVGVNMTDPVGFGLVASEARPGTNVTGGLYRLGGMAGEDRGICAGILPRAPKVRGPRA